MAKRKQRSDNLSYRDRGDKLITKFGHGQPCAVCGTSAGVCLHHLLPKSRFARYRFRLENLVPLCPTHHLLSNNLAPHSTNFLAVERFHEWLILNRPSQESWCRNAEAEAHQLTGKIDWSDLYTALVNDLSKLSLTREERSGIVDVKAKRKDGDV